MAKTLEEIFGVSRETPTQTQKPKRRSLEDIFGVQKTTTTQPETPTKIAPPVEKPKPPKRKEDKGIISRIGDIFAKRSSQAGEIIKELPEEKTFAEKALQISGQFIAGAGESLFEGVKSTLKFITPDDIEEGIKKKGVELLQSEKGKDVLNVIAKGSEAYQEWRKDNLRAARNIEAVFNIAEIVPLLRDAKGVTVFKNFAEGVKDVALVPVKKASKETLDIIKPKLTSKQKAAAIEQGRGVKSRIKGEITIKPSKLDKQVAKSVDGIVKSSNDPFKNVSNIRTEIAKIADRVEKGLKNNNAIFNKNQLKTALSSEKEESTILFGGKKSIEDAYDSVVDKFIKIIDKKPKTISGLLSTRKEFDQVIKKKFPHIFDKIGGDNVRANAVFDIRNAANKFIADKLPKGNTFRADLFRQSDMFTAAKNISNNAVSLIDTTRVSRGLDVIKKHPAVSILGAAGIGAGISSGTIVSILSSPITLGAIVAGGSMKLGKEIITRKKLRDSLILFLNNAKRELSESEQVDIQSLIDEISQNNRQKRLEEIFNR